MSMTGRAAEISAPTPGAPEKAAVRSMFDRIAPRYDLLNRLLSAGTDVRWRRRCIDAVTDAGARNLLDVCSGTGDLAVEFLRRGEDHRAVGVDISPAMLGQAAKKLRGGFAPERWAVVVGDAERLPVRSGGFDAAVVAFGIRNVGDVGAGLAEMRRAVRPGGRVVVLEFSMPPGMVGALYRLYFNRALPAIGGWISGDRGAYSYLPASVARFATPKELGASMERAGLSRVRWRRLTAGVAHLYIGDRIP